MCERLSTMGIAVNLVTYLVGTMHLPSAESANIVTDFMGTSFLLCLLGGFGTDQFDENDDKEKSQMASSSTGSSSHQHAPSLQSQCWSTYRTSGPELGLCHLLHLHAYCHLRVPLGDQEIQVQEELGKPNRPHSPSCRGCSEEEELNFLPASVSCTRTALRPPGSITRNSFGSTNLQRIGIGLALSVAGMVAAALSEGKGSQW
ncbi:Protein NRT1/ PTR FAMILY 6.3 [Ananas comosus]|uniref:Protein NRT1/ PTR FAMILY 6.3 n=1 Tax=Ananas comosus TaxID=4615 RepID=A0A199V506_ANACO|nr:Protein NRT1/ PTR FAMILY 6.3 [Ananas comosus]